MTLNASQNTLESAACAGRIKGVLFDIDETIVDLYRAMADAMVFASQRLLPNATAADWDSFAALYMADPHKYYDRYVQGEFSFAQQRGLRARVVFDHLGFTGFDGAVEQRWIAEFEEAQPPSIRAFADVVPLLDALDAAGIPYGAVSNNVYDYQRAKLDAAGLARIQVLVGIDTVNVGKPAPEIFLEGCRQLGTAPSETLYVGDNFMIDGVGSVRAGLLGVWLSREGKAAPGVADNDAQAAARIVSVANLAELLAIVGIQAPADWL
ncbi:HAD family hydrolase [Arthrobacter glacialis]|uniref:HAD family hydrolase n=1 Tax=Arthrobacter glacialis TaxID=1664 RepID=A0A2S3ZYQ9_ARTGL|nr:HAD family hydrolase [Arthrobacter glacialis]POH74406.1 HAD family hydrolase [Arthrobacter glacialis]